MVTHLSAAAKRRAIGKHIKNATAECSGDLPGQTAVPRRECGAKNAAVVSHAMWDNRLLEMV